MKASFSRRTVGEGNGRGSGFTLIELLVVMTIIAILAAMVYPGAMAIMRKVKKVQATQAATSLRAAIGTYSSEYRRYPVAADGKVDRDLEVITDEDLMGVLLASDKEKGPGGLNQRGRVLFNGRKVSNADQPRNGIVYQPGGGGVLYDPWGKPYRVILDTNRDERCANPSPGGEAIAQDVLVWSCGPDGEDNRGQGDDLTIW